MANTLIGCGGTGAHVALALTRLHALGDPLGFFRQNGRSVDLPALYLLDQDDGDSADPNSPTAWQMLRRVIDGHPAQGSPDRIQPTPRTITPLPVGPNEDFLFEGMTSLSSRYPSSDYLDCIFSREQTRIEFSRGMMGSPAVGSLLFKLKSYDTKVDDASINHDRVYHELLNVKGRVAVVGSGMGGTGAAVGPTLAKELSAADERQVMAVMILNWFEFDTLHDHLDDNVLKAQRRNKNMLQNAHSGLRYYGRRLVEHAATVPVGIPREAMESRLYSGDNHQPMLEAYPHAVAAICCLRQFLDKDAYSNGLYHLDAEDPSRLGPGTDLPGGGTIGGLVAGAKTVVSVVETYEKILTSSTKHVVDPIVTTLVGDRGNQVAKSLGDMRRAYEANLHWLDRMLKGSSPIPVRGPFANEVAIRRRLRTEGKTLDSLPFDSTPQAASRILGWIAEWVGEELPHQVASDPNGVYWPEMFEDQGLTPSPKKAGTLQKVSKPDVQATLDSFVDRNQVVQNGWPHPLAAVDYFGHAIAEGKPRAIRQLELLLLGVFVGELGLHPTQRRDGRPVSVDEIVDEHRKSGQGRGLAGYAIKRTGDPDVIMGFTAPRTLLCPSPGLPDSLWSGLWKALTGKQDRDWHSDQSGWGTAASSVRRLRAWIVACKRRRPNETPPPWTEIFESVNPEGAYGGGIELEVFWSGDNPAKVFLPTQDEGSIPDAVNSLPAADHREFLRKYGEVELDRGRRFWICQFEIPDDGKVHGIWDDHLRYLQQSGAIEFYGYDDSLREVRAVVPSEASRAYHVVTLRETMVLRHGDIAIRKCIPLEQRNVPNGDTDAGVLYPDLPLRWQYFDLAKPKGSRDHASYLDLCRKGDAMPRDGLRPSKVDEIRQEAIWRIGLRGRSDVVIFATRIEISDPRHAAHWMVWPRFKAQGWKAYYLYHRSTHARVRVGALWLNENERTQGSDLRYVDVNKDQLGHPVPIQFSHKHGRHAGGPPVAFCAKEGRDDIGLYVINLDQVGPAPAALQVGIDFGTSHTTAALKLGERGVQALDLDPELALDAKHRLSLHVSENLDHIENEDEHGPLVRGSWFPRYISDLAGELTGLWPSEIRTIPPVDMLKNLPIDRWTPGVHYVIPPVGLLRHDLPKHKISNFKWDTSELFRKKERLLRRIYLDRIVEQTLAEAFVRHGRPDRSVQFTFTYPLRTPPQKIRDYQATLSKVLEEGSRGLGTSLALHNDIGLFDESHAAVVGTERSGDVNLVGDLGGGTLDLIISAVGGEFEDVADSVRLGGNVLLRQIARTVPFPEGWGGGNDALAKLTAWVRTHGLTSLFGGATDIVDECRFLGVSGFSGRDEPKQVRTLIRRYYFLVTEFMARNLVAYVAKHWMPAAADHDQLRIRVYLRGNGWKLWHERKTYGQVGRAVQQRVIDAVGRLWPTLKVDFAVVGNEDWRDDHHESSQADRAKRDVVKEVVGRSMDPDRIRDRWFSHTLVDLIRREQGGDQTMVDWYERIPFRTGGEGVKIELSDIRPRIPLDDLDEASDPREIGELSDRLTRTINRRLREEGELVGDAELDYRGAVGAWVWEAALAATFDSHSIIE